MRKSNEKSNTLGTDSKANLDGAKTGVPAEPHASGRERAEDRTGTPATAETQGPEGGCLSNTHPSSSQIPLAGYPNYLAAGGIDWLEWGGSVLWPDATFKILFGDFERAKVSAQEAKKPFEWLDVQDLGPLKVLRSGLNRGGDRGQHFEYKVEVFGISIGLAGISQGSSTRQNYMARLTGEYCLLLGAEEGLTLIREIIEIMGGTIETEQLSRGDCCLDIVNMSPAELQTPLKRQQFVTRARSVIPYENLVTEDRTGFVVGCKPCRLIVYDKLKEQKKSCNYLYHQAMIDRRWGGIEPLAATRIEFQLQRRCLLKRGIDTPDDFIEKRGALLQELTHNFFRLTDRPVDRKNKNQTRTPTHPLWSAIQQACVDVHGVPTGELAPVQRERILPDRLIRQARGCLANALHQMGWSCQKHEDFTRLVTHLLVRIAASDEEQQKFIEEFNRQATRYTA